MTTATKTAATTTTTAQPAQPAQQQLVRPSPVQAMERFLTARAKRLAEWAAGRLDPAALIRFALMDYSRDEKLRACTPESIYLALIACAQTGLEPGSLRQHAFIYPFRNVATFIMGWRGLVHLGHRSKVRLRPELRYEGDEWLEDKGTVPRLIHRPAHKPGAALLGAYAVAAIPDADADWEYMPLEELEKVKAFAVKMRGGRLGAYEDWNNEMMRKAPIKRIGKRLPLGEDYLRARAIDNAVETGDLVTYKNLIDTEGELPELRAAVDEESDAEPAQPQRGAAAAKEQLRKRRAATTVDVVDRDPIEEEVANIRESLSRILENPQWMPALKERIAKLPAADRVALEQLYTEAEGELAAARRQDDLPDFFDTGTGSEP